MNQLHWVLLVIAAVLLVVLYLYGKWQEHRSARFGAARGELDTDSDEHPLPDRVALRSARQAHVRIEPTMGLPPDGEAAAAVSVADDLSSEVSADNAPSVGGWTEDAMLDLILELRCVHSFDGVAALEARAQLERLALPVPTHLAVWDSKSGRWSLPDRFGFYSEMLVAVQLANRRHVLGEIDASRYIAALQQIAVSIDADFDPPDVTRIVQRAHALDALCARFDVQITLTLQALGEPWTSSDVEAAATDVGLTAETSARWRRPEGDSTALSMTHTDSFPTQRLTLTLDVPGSSPQPPPLTALFEAAHRLASRLNARVVDDNGKVVEPQVAPVIEGELDKLFTDMRTAGIVPGSTRARRLYGG